MEYPFIAESRSSVNMLYTDSRVATVHAGPRIFAALAAWAILLTLSVHAGSSLSLTATSSQYVLVQPNPSFAPTNLTFEAWVNPGVAKCDTIFSRGDGSDINTDYIFQVGYDGTNCGVMKLSFFGAGGWDCSFSLVSTNTWTHVAVTYDGTNKQFFINGVLNTNAHRPGPLHATSSSPLYIGRQGTACNCNFFQGALAEVRFWNTIRTSNQISASMNVELTGREAGLVAYYRLNEGSGTTADDATGNNNTGTLMAGASWTNSAPPLQNGSFSLATSSLWEGRAAGSDSVVLAATVPEGLWTATTNAPWLHLSPANQSGAGSTNLIFSFDTNSGPTRTGTLTIGGQTLTITQAGATFVPANPLTVLASGFFFPTFLTADLAGNVFIPDTENNVIKEWSPANGSISTIVGSGLSYPYGVAEDAAGNLYIADSQDFAFKKWSGGTLSTLVNFIIPNGLASDAAGDTIYLAGITGGDGVWSVSSNTFSHTVVQGPSPVGTFFSRDVALDAAGNIYSSTLATTSATNSGTNSITVLSAASQTWSTVATGFTEPFGVAVDVSGNVFFTDNKTKAIEWRSALSNTVSPFLLTQNFPNGVTVDALRNIYFDDLNSLYERPAAFVDTNSLTVSGSGGTNNFSIFLPPAESLQSPFTPTADQPWITFVGASNGVVSVAVQPSNLFPPLPRSGHITILGQTISLTQAAPAYALSSYALDESPGSGIDSVMLAVSPATNTWTASTTNSWLHLSVTNGTGSATITFTFDPNPGPPRTGAIVIAGLTLTITQPLAYQLSSTELDEGIGAGSDSVVLTANALDTNEWTASALAPWLHLATNGVGSATINFTFDSNFGLARTGTCLIAGLTLTVIQSTSYALTTNVLNEPYPAGTDSVMLVGVPPSDTWTASANDSWLHLTNQNGTGSTTVYFNFDSDFGLNRTGTLTIAGQTLTVIQAGSYALIPTAVLEPPTSGTDSVMLTGVPATSNWVASTTTPWLHLNATGGTGSTNISFTFDANSDATRSGAITIAGLTFTVTQAQPYFLGAPFRYEAPAAGTDTIVLAAAYPWTAVPNANWLHMDPASQSGTNGGVLKFLFDANPGPTRSGTLSIAGLTLTITQAGSTFVPARMLGPVALGCASVTAVDGAGNLYTYEPCTASIVEHFATNSAPLTLVSNLTCDAITIGVDGIGNVYWAERCGALREWRAADGTTLKLLNIIDPGVGYGTSAIGVDGVGNIYNLVQGGLDEVWRHADGGVGVFLFLPGYSRWLTADVAANQYFSYYPEIPYLPQIQKFSASDGSFEVLMTVTNNPDNVAVDGAGNVFATYNATPAQTFLREWSAATGGLTDWFLGFAGGNSAINFSADAVGNIYFPSNASTGLAYEMPYALVDASGRSEGNAAGADALPAVLPATANLTGAFLPASDSPWLTVTGVTNGVISFSFTVNTNGPRTGNISVLGQAVPIRQGFLPLPTHLTASFVSSNRTLQISFTNIQNAAANLTVLMSTNLSMPLSNWTALGSPIEGPPGQYQFTAPAATNSRGFYIIRSP